MQVKSGILLCQVFLILGLCLWLGTALPRNDISKTLLPLRSPCYFGQECESEQCSCGQCMGCVDNVCYMELCPQYSHHGWKWDIYPRISNLL